MKKTSRLLDFVPLATSLRPHQLEDFVGQAHLLGPNQPLSYAIEHGLLHSMVLWGPPGTGKTSLAKILAQAAQAEFISLSAIATGIKEIKDLVSRIKNSPIKQYLVLFIDEIHRFNKAQQDIFLPYIEDGTFILIGATTENPSFELTKALLSRLRVYVLNPLTQAELAQIFELALSQVSKNIKLDFPTELQEILINAADGDARQMLNLLDITIQLAQSQTKTSTHVINRELLQNVLQVNLRKFDKGGEYFYDQISALHKSIRGSAPDAAMYWLARLLDGGCDPQYILRRLIRAASEDIGLADPRALDLTLHAAMGYERLGSPEGELALAQAVIYLSCAPKSNAVYLAFNAAMTDVKHSASHPVPLHLRNAPTQLMKDLNYGKNYRYAHNEAQAYVPNEQYFPDSLKPKQYYQPTDYGLESKIKERLKFLHGLDQAAKKN